MVTSGVQGVVVTAKRLLLVLLMIYVCVTLITLFEWELVIQETGVELVALRVVHRPLDLKLYSRVKTHQNR